MNSISIKEENEFTSNANDKKNNITQKESNTKNNLSKSQNVNYFHKYYKNKKKEFLKNKRKNKNKSKNEIPDTPHNTGQYLCHIYQAQESKNKQKQENNENDDMESGLNFFDEDDDDYDGLDNFDFKYNEDSKRERLMSMEGKELEDFLYSPGEKKEEKKISKSAISFDNKENHLDLELNVLDDCPIIEEKK